MSHLRLLLVAVLALGVCELALAEPVPLANGHGLITKVEDKSVSISPRGPDGKLEKAITLKVTGTTSLTLVGTRKTKGKLIITQKSIKAKDLESKQTIAFIYTKEGGDVPTLLSGVVQPSAEK